MCFKISQIEVVYVQHCTHIEGKGRPRETCDLNCAPWLWFVTRFRSCHVYSIHQSSHSQPQRQFTRLMLWFCCSSHQVYLLRALSTHQNSSWISLIDEPFTKLTRRGSWHAEVTHVLFVWMCPALSVLCCYQQSRVWPTVTLGTTGQASCHWMTLRGWFQAFECTEYTIHPGLCVVCTPVTHVQRPANPILHLKLWWKINILYVVQNKVMKSSLFTTS